MVIFLLLASLPNEYKEFNQIQIKGNLSLFHEIEARLLDEELTLKLEVEKDEISKAMYLNKVLASSKSNPTSKNSNARSDKKSKPNAQKYESKSSQSGLAKRKQTSNKRKQQKPLCSYYNDPNYKGRFSEEQCEIKKSVEQMKSLDVKLKQLQKNKPIKFEVNIIAKDKKAKEQEDSSNSLSDDIEDVIEAYLT
jgi:hypothetical protein